MKKALVAYERALQWRELFDLAMREGLTEEELKEMGYRVAGVCNWCNWKSLIHLLIVIDPEELTSKKRYIESGQVLLDYAKDIRSCVDALVQGNNFSEAHRLVRNDGNLFNLLIITFSLHRRLSMVPQILFWILCTQLHLKVERRFPKIWKK